MKIAILGYGRMGKTIEQIALDRNHEIVYKTSEKIIRLNLSLYGSLFMISKTLNRGSGKERFALSIATSEMSVAVTLPLFLLYNSLTKPTFKKAFFLHIEICI